MDTDEEKTRQYDLDLVNNIITDIKEHHPDKFINSKNLYNTFISKFNQNDNYDDTLIEIQNILPADTLTKIKSGMKGGRSRLRKSKKPKRKENKSKRGKKGRRSRSRRRIRR